MTDIDSPVPRFEETDRCPLTTDTIANRGAADLFVRQYAKSDNSWEVLSVATLDPGTDLGPFLSAIYAAGVITIDDSGCVTFTYHKPCNVLWHVEGMKVEAIAEPAHIERLLENSGLSIATDDEGYNGVWRALPLSTDAQLPSRMLFRENVIAEEARLK